MSSQALSHRTILDAQHKAHRDKEHQVAKSETQARSCPGDMSPQSRPAQKRKSTHDSDESTSLNREGKKQHRISEASTTTKLQNKTAEVDNASLSRKQSRSMLELVKKLRERSKTDYFDAPVNPENAPGYHSPNNPEETAWNTEVMYFDKMLAKASAGHYDRDPNIRLSRVEFDFNLMIYNAIIYNNQKHPVNVAARALHKKVQKILQGWMDGALLCRKCGGDEVYIENRILICDYCCEGVHDQCQDERRPDEQGHHPLRKESSWFCSQACRKTFFKIAKKFQLPEEELGEHYGGPQPLSFRIEDGQLVLACLGDEAMCPGVTSLPTTPEHNQEAQRFPDRPMVLWQQRGSRATWGFASSYKVIDENFDFLSYIEDVEQNRKAAFVEQLLWAIKNSKFENTISPEILSAIAMKGKRNKKQVYRQHDDAEKGAKGCAIESSQDAIGETKDSPATQKNASPLPANSETQSEADVESGASRRRSDPSIASRAEDKHHKKVSGRNDAEVLQKPSSDPASKGGSEEKKKRPQNPAKQHSKSTTVPPGQERNDQVGGAIDADSSSKIEKYSLNALLQRIPDRNSEGAAEGESSTAGGVQATTSTENESPVDATDPKIINEMVRKHPVKLIPKYEINGKFVGVHCPASESIVGKNTPRSKKCEQVCQYCSRIGHQGFECPALFAKVHSRPLPGFNMDGTRNPGQWCGDCILQSTALEWVTLEEEGYFAYGTPQEEELSDSNEQMEVEKEKRGEDEVDRAIDDDEHTDNGNDGVDKENEIAIEVEKESEREDENTNKHVNQGENENNLDDSMDSSSTTQVCPSERGAEDSLSTGRPSIEASNADSSRSTGANDTTTHVQQTDDSLQAAVDKVELSASASGVGERKAETDAGSSKQGHGDSNVESRKDLAQVGSSKPTTHQVQDSCNGAHEGSSRMMEIEAETTAADVSKQADGAQVASTTSPESMNSAGPANARHEPAHTDTTDTKQQARSHQPQMSNIQSIALQPAGASGAGPSSQPGVANVNNVNLGLSLPKQQGEVSNYIGVKQLRDGRFGTAALIGSKWVAMHPFATRKLAARAYDVILARHFNFQIPPHVRLNFPQDYECTCEVVQIFSEAKQKILNCEVIHEDGRRTSPSANVTQAQQASRQPQGQNYLQADVPRTSSATATASAVAVSRGPTGKSGVNSARPAAATYPHRNPVLQATAVPLEIQSGGHSKIVQATAVVTSSNQPASQPMNPRTYNVTSHMQAPVGGQSSAPDPRQGAIRAQLPANARVQVQHNAHNDSMSPRPAAGGLPSPASTFRAVVQQAASSRPTVSSSMHSILTPHQALKNANEREQRARAELMDACKFFNPNTSVEFIPAEQITNLKNLLWTYGDSLATKLAAIDQLKSALGISLETSTVTAHLAIVKQAKDNFNQCLLQQRMHDKARQDYTRAMQSVLDGFGDKEKLADRHLEDIARCNESFFSYLKQIWTCLQQIRNESRPGGPAKLTDGHPGTAAPR